MNLIGRVKGILFQQCDECGTLFDLNYEFEGRAEELLQSRIRASKPLCWTCKNYQEIER
ncbi:MAG: hypothetical protein Q8L29_00710 [archaeon]|nr:hypothetical protein [archaeon]